MSQEGTMLKKGDLVRISICAISNEAGGSSIAIWGFHILFAASFRSRRSHLERSAALIAGKAREIACDEKLARTFFSWLEMSDVEMNLLTFRVL